MILSRIPAHDKVEVGKQITVRAHEKDYIVRIDVLVSMGKDIVSFLGKSGGRSANGYLDFAHKKGGMIFLEP